jgi:hypothetical protein
MTGYQFGPQTTQIKALIRRAAQLTPAQQAALADGDEDVTTALYMARDAYTDIVSSRCDGLSEIRRSAAALAESELAYATQHYSEHHHEAAYRTIKDAIHALQIRNMVGEGLFRQRHYDALTARAVRMLGPLHPGDPGSPLTTHTIVRVTRTIIQDIWVDTDDLLEAAGGKLPAPGENIQVDQVWDLIDIAGLNSPNTDAELYDADEEIRQLSEYDWQRELGPAEVSPYARSSRRVQEVELP